MRVRRRAAAEETQRLACGDGVPGTRRDEDRVSTCDLAGLAIDLDHARAFQDEVKLFRCLVVVPLGGTSGGHLRLCEALLLHGSVRPIENAADGGAILGDEGDLFGELDNGHVVGLRAVCRGDEQNPPALNRREVSRVCSPAFTLS